MIWLLFALASLLLLFALIVFTKITIIINYFHHNDNDDLKIEFRIWFGLIKYKKHIPLIKIDDDSPTVVLKSTSQMGDSSPKDKNSEHKIHQFGKNDFISNLKNTREILERVFHLHIIVRKFFKKVTIKQFEWHTLMGVGDAAQTGVLTGVIWAIKGSIVGLASQYIKLKKLPDLSVTPHFQQTIVQTRLRCIFQFRVGHAILAGLKMVKFWKGGQQHFKENSPIGKPLGENDGSVALMRHRKV